MLSRHGALGITPLLEGRGSVCAGREGWEQSSRQAFGPCMGYTATRPLRRSELRVVPALGRPGGHPLADCPCLTRVLACLDIAHPPPVSE